MTDRIAVLQADIAKLEIDAIVNAANEGLRPGGGVDGAIRRAAGWKLNAAAMKIGGCPTGEAVVTEGFALPARWIIHTAGPVWKGGGAGEDEQLARCYRSCMARAAEIGARRVAFPAISTGVYGFPADRAAAIAVREIRAALASGADFDEIVLVAFGGDDLAVLSAALAPEGGGGEGAA